MSLGFLEVGLIWIGPSAKATRALGDKISAGKVAQDVGGPSAPGTDGPVKSAAQPTASATWIVKGHEAAALSGFPQSCSSKFPRSQG